MTDSEHVTIREAARRYRVSDKKLQRAIRAEKLRASYPKPNRCEIAVSDLERFLSGQMSGRSTEPLESRVAELEQRVADLEERTIGSLPRQFISLLAFARDHNVAEFTVQTHVGMGFLPAKHGEWTNVDGTVVTLALDAKGKAAFFQIYREFPMFLACKQCPHGYPDMSRQSRGDALM